MKGFKYTVSLVMVLAFALVFVGCAKPPEAEQKAAQAAMDLSPSPSSMMQWVRQISPFSMQMPAVSRTA